MPYIFRFLKEQDFVLVKGEGRLSGAEIIETVVKMFEHPDWTLTIDQLCDFQELTSISVTFEDIKAIIDLEQRYDDRMGPGKQAFVVRSEMHEMLCKLYKALARLRRRPQQIQIFRSMEPALEWLQREHLTEALALEL